MKNRVFGHLLGMVSNCCMMLVANKRHYFSMMSYLGGKNLDCVSIKEMLSMPM